MTHQALTGDDTGLVAAGVGVADVLVAAAVAAPPRVELLPVDPLGCG